MGFHATPGERILQKQDDLAMPKTHISFLDLFYEEVPLYGLSGFRPLKLKIRMLNATLPEGRLVLERAVAEGVLVNGQEVQVFSNENKGGRTFSSSSSVGDTGTHGPTVSLRWTTADLTLVGDSSIITGTTMVFRGPESYANLLVHATSDALESPLLRLRRAYDTPVTGEVLGAGNGVDTSFSFTIANTPIAPNSLAISFTDSGGAKSGRIRDNGEGKLTTTPDPSTSPNDLLLSSADESTINYDTGEVVINFDSNHTPTASSITADYEHSSSGSKDEARYRIDWSMGEFD